jgi:hypothetical protein
VYISGEEDKSIHISSIIRNFPEKPTDAILCIQFQKMDEDIKSDDDNKNSESLCWVSDSCSKFGREDYESIMRVIKVFPLVNNDEVQKISKGIT